MIFRGRKLLDVLLASFATASLAWLSSAANANTYPSKPITVIVPFAAGGPTDASARAVASALAQEMGKSFVVENVPGAGGSIGTARAAAASPDGYTLLWGTGSGLSILPNLKPLSYDARKSFAPISMVLSAPFVFAASPRLEIKTIEEFIALGKSRPMELNYSSSGTGGTAHMIGELFNMKAGIEAVHVPYNGGAPMMHALLAGDVDYAFDTPTSIVPLAEDKRIIPLAVTSLKRWPALPDVRTLDEIGYKDFDATTWFGLLAPANTPADRIELISKSVQKVLANPETRGKLEKSGFFVDGTTPAEFAKKIDEDTKLWAELIQNAKIKITN